MATQLLTIPYCPAVFNSIPDLQPARLTFEARNGETFVKDVLGPMIIRYKLEEVFGVGMVHRHFDINETERLVEFNNITMPWVVKSETSGARLGRNLVYGSSWILDRSDRGHGGKWMAYEFAYSPNGSDQNVVNIDDEKYHDFLVEFTSAITAANMGAQVGLRAWPGKGFRGGLEITEQRANILLVPGQFSKDDHNFTTVNWFWAPEYLDGDCACACGWTKTGFHLLHNHV